MASITQYVSQTRLTNYAKHHQRAPLRVEAVQPQPASKSATGFSRRNVFLGISSGLLIGAQERANACQADPYGSEYYRTTTANLNNLMLRLVSGESEAAGTVAADSAQYLVDWQAWKDYTVPTPCNRSTCYAEVRRRGQHMSQMITSLGGVYDSSKDASTDKYTIRIGEIAEIFASGSTCDPIQAYM
mmetsp:Transcript_34180/g.47379  ORF Transcript_34180/g.47379 Transcript_34180/m.47379 type:complete len:187 (+) Transcript_34180:131-691(+)|eukprot:CAMPEP_0196570560 /NCGR_PEP_ID=MMETSP1081-20130531/696_1 /TAXON_ID=36882 /ORGANISM="Pyramimonas amylifera, Strain CCMP720" /LENGTH=186 /DNA_ID=CAMNT_0041887079 /DNA_START=131 /DNA_END=691 /DNA_ORIENTATION=+